MQPEERAEWGRRAMERVAERYSWDAVTDQYEALLVRRPYYERDGPVRAIDPGWRSPSNKSSKTSARSATWWGRRWK